MCHMCLLEMIILCPLLTGMTVAEVNHVFCSSGENVHLPCNNTLSNCTSTTWIYTRHSETVELIGLGIKKNDIERRERLSLGSDCSLNIKTITQEDYGLYTCQQYVNEQKQGTDAPVYLHFLHVSSSSSQTEIRPGSSVTLYCQLYYYGVDCDYLVHSEGIQLVWVNQAGVNLTTDSRYQISFSSTHCVSTLTTTLLNEDLNREWRCLVIQRNQPKTSTTFTVKYSAPTETKTSNPVISSKTTTTVNKPVTSTQSASATSSALILATTSNSEKKTGPTAPARPKKLVIVIVGVVAALAVLLPVVIFWVICKKRRDNRRGTNEFLVTDMKKI
ncbi:V-set and immunoglobulin domain-containing protein 10-like [Megalobrama amblycephala]|uniref:V-set and immunoglobulin domain-containing protein 10-like n=1 Tax=Megalobrama amblycephala TaxID=75352 RepID=UPI002014138C|nr:V-set and immunoglobulin domain-containing protein 10-like [Megalobrama amblycephala]